MAEKKRLPFTALATEQLGAAFERNLSHADRGQRPERVDADVWERYAAGRPWVLLNVGIIGLRLRRPETIRVLREASRSFIERRSNYWLVAELLASHGSIHGETAFGTTIVDTVVQTVRATIETKKGVRESVIDDRYARLEMEAVSLLFCAIAKNADPHDRWPIHVFDDDRGGGVDDLLRGIRSADRDVDRRLGNMRAIAGRRFSSQANLASLRSLIWGAVAASTFAEDERDKGFALIGVEPILDPVTLATAMLVLQEGSVREDVLEEHGLLVRGARQRPRGWDDAVDLEAGTQAYLEYLAVLRQGQQR